MKRPHCIFNVVELHRPYSGQYKGMRVVVAEPNMAGYKFMSNTPAPSFRKPYLIYESSDFQAAEFNKILSDELRKLAKLFDKVEYFELYAFRMHQQGDKHEKAKETVVLAYDESQRAQGTKSPTTNVS